MTRNDTATRRTVTGIVSAVGLFAGADSYTHIYGLARDWHASIISAALTPLTADGMVFASTAAMFAATRQGRPIPARARFWFWVGTIITIVSNGASGWRYGTGTALLNLWPVVAYIGCMEVLTWMLQHLWGPQKKPVTSTATLRATKTETIVPAPQAPEPQDIKPGLRQYAPRRPLDELLADARVQFADMLTAGKLPASRAIQDIVRCGPGKAEQVLARLAELQSS